MMETKSIIDVVSCGTEASMIGGGCVSSKILLVWVGGSVGRWEFWGVGILVRR